MSAITITSPIPQVSILVSEAALERIDQVLHASGVIASIPEGDEAAFKAADVAYQQLQAMARDIEKQREALKAPALAFGRTLDATAKDAAVPLEAEKVRLGAVIKAWQKRENELREAAAQRAREERDRLQREADQRAEEERLERIRLAEEQRQRELDAMPKEDPVPGEDPVPADEPPPVDQEVFTAPARPVVVPTRYVPPPVKSSVREKTTKVLVIDDASLIPDQIGGVPLWVVDEAAVKRLLLAKMQVPGARLDEVIGTAPTGR